MTDARFWGPEEWARHYSVLLRGRTLREAERFPWDKRVLSEPDPFEPDLCVKDTHLAFLGVQRYHSRTLSVETWEGIATSTSQPSLRLQWPDNLRTGYLSGHGAVCRSRWYLMPLSMWEASRGLTYEQQRRLLPPSYEVPHAIEEATKLILYRTLTGARADEESHARCRDDIGHGDRPLVGGSETGTVTVSLWPEAYSAWAIGLAASRRHP